MAAGHSAAGEAARLRAEAEQAEYVARTKQEMARNYEAAAKSERWLGALLKPLADRGYTILEDRKWPGSKKAQVDFVLIGPSGIYIVDAKSWKDVTIENDRIYQGQDDVTDRFDGLTSLGNLVEEALADIGIAPGEVHLVAVFTNRRGLRARVGGVEIVGRDVALHHLIGCGDRLDTDVIQRVRTVLEELLPPYAMPEGPTELTLPAPVIPITEQEALISIEEIENALWANVLAKPVESWMAYLHPDQARLARRTFNGPSRIRGAVGTGKTVVALHRAAYIARTRPGKVLVTTYVRTLPSVLSALMNQMSPDIADRIEFRGIHGFAIDLLKSRNVTFRLEPEKADRAFRSAWSSMGKENPLVQIDERISYWKEEVLSVIKGRGLTRFEDYVQLPRAGRSRRLSSENRIAVWKLHTAYDTELRKLGIVDFEDVILLAEQNLRSTPLEGYCAVIVDEAQDMSCAMIRMLHAIVGDRPDGLSLVGDGQQTIYPGGYNLAEAGVSLHGRGVILNRNYRNTAEILDFASRLVEGDEYFDIEGAPAQGDATVEVMRHGPEPKVGNFKSRAKHDDSVMEHVKSLIAQGVALGDIGILAHTNRAATEVGNLLTKAGIAWIELLKYDGMPTDAIKVGTIKRAKGLEFKQVLVVRTPSRLLHALPNDPDAEDERRELDRRELYVAMTRARDGLWVGVA
ncbi:MAG: AAA family ATPase [Homoserinimonas sp.]|nr:AAA family ATPase [Homoserinimonas sp.]